MSPLLAAAPLAVVLLGMTVLRRSAVLAGGAGLAVAAALWAAYGFGDEPPIAAARTALGAFAEAGHSAATILWIILPALALYEFQQRTGALDRIRATLASLSEDRRIQTLLIAWFFGLFMEGAAGFGTPVALAAPLLAGLGHPPVRAVALALLGHAAGVSFGAVGTPVAAQVQILGLPPETISGPTAALHVLAGPMLLLAMTRLADEGPLTRRDLGWAGAAALCFFIPSLLLALLAGPELPTLGGALLGAAAFIALLRRRSRGPAPDFRALAPDLAPYIAILGLVLATRLVPPAQEALTSVALGWTFHDRFRGIFLPLHHPGTMLLLGLLAGAAATGRAKLLPQATRAAALRLPTVALALLTMLTLSRFMVHAGMIGTLAETAAGAGSAWPAIAPLVGVLGTFITGSATSSNILFTDLQATTAAALGLSVPVMAAAQGFGAAIGNVVAPHNIIAGGAAVGLAGREGEILRRTAGPCLACALAGGAALLAFVWFPS